MVNVEGFLSADLIAQQNFGAARRGYDPEEVRAFLAKVAAEIVALHERQAALEEARRDAEYRAAHPSFDEETLFGAVGDETAHILKSAHEAASDIKSRAGENASRILKEGHAQAEVLRAQAETVLARRTEEAEAVAARIMETARAEAERLVDQARQQAKAIRAQAEAERNAMIEGAQSTREKILSALSRKRNVAVAQVEALRAGRERLLGSYQVVRRTLDEATAELARAESDARAAADAVRHRPLTLDEPDGLGDDDEPTNPTLPIIRRRLRSATAGDAADEGTARPATSVPPPEGPVRAAPGSGPSRAGSSAADEGTARPATSVAPPKSPVGAAPGSGPSRAGSSSPPIVTRARSTDQVSPSATPPSPAARPSRISERTSGTAPAVRPDAGPTSSDVQRPWAAGAPHAAGNAPPPSGSSSRPRGEPAASAAAPAPPHPAEQTSPSPAPAEASPVPAPADASTAATRDSSDPDSRNADRQPADGAGDATPARADAAGAEPAAAVAAASVSAKLDGGPSELTEPFGAADSEGEPPAVHTTPSGGVESLFARIRADRDRAVAHARVVLAGERPIADERPIPDQDEALLQHRDEALGPIEANLTRRLKRALQDDQNDLLDRLRGLRSSQKAAAVVLPTRDAHVARFRDAGRPFLAEAMAAGVGFTEWLMPGLRLSEHLGGVDRSADELAEAIVEPLRRRLESLLVAGEGDDPVVLAEVVGAAYREWKTKRVEVVAADQVTSAFAAAAYAATPAGTSLRWLVEDSGGPCPDCDDNALAGGQPKGEPFPTGQQRPPAHPGCRCLLIPRRSSP